MDVESALAEMEQLLADARRAPLSASVIVNRKDFDELISEIRAALPDELRQSRWVLKERDDVLAQAAREAEQLVADARSEQERLVSEAEVVRAAQKEADRIIADAHEQARVMRLEAEDYMDSKLAKFEVSLQRTLQTVAQGREQLRGRLGSDELAPDDERIIETQENEDPPGARLYDHEA